MVPTTTTTPRINERATRRSPLRPDTIGLIVVLVLAPLIALIAASAELITIGIIGAAILLLLVVLWSAEATFYVLIFSMLLSPEFIVGGLEGPSAATATRGVTLRLDDYLILIISFAWLIRLAVYKEAALLRRTPLNLPIFAYLGFSALVTLWGALLGNLNLVTGAFFVLKYLEYAFVYFLVVNYVRDRDQIRRLLIAVLVTAVLISLIGIAQIPAGGRVSAPFEGEAGEPNTLGGYLVFIMAFGLAYLGQSRQARDRVVFLAVVGLMTLPLAYTYSRTSWLAFVAMLAATIVLSRDKAIFLSLIAVALIIFAVSPPRALVERAAYTLSSQRQSVQFLGYTIEPSAAARLQAWVTAANAVAENPLTGAGVTGAGLIDAQYPRVIAETGFIGLGIFLWLLWRLAACALALRHLGRTQLEAVLANGFLAGFAGLVVHGIGANTFIIVRIMEPMWLMAGLVGSALLIRQAREATDAAAREGPRGVAQAAWRHRHDPMPP
jgi:O-antigen ligase